MKYPHLTPYSLVAGSIGVVEIAAPLTTRFSPNTHLATVYEELGGPPFYDFFCLVCDEQRLYGYLAGDDDLLSTSVSTAGEAAHPITADLLVSASTPLLDLPELFLKHYFFFILSGHEVTHVVSFQDMDSLPMKLCLFSLFLELESKLLALFSVDTARLQRYLSALSPNRLKKAQDLCEMKYTNQIPENILLCTTFIDKKEMILRAPELASKLHFPNKDELGRTFKRIENVRNQIAHGDSVISVLPTPQHFNDFVNELRAIISSIGLQGE